MIVARTELPDGSHSSATCCRRSGQGRWYWLLSHRLAREVLATGAHLLGRAKASFSLRPVKVLADGTYLARLNPARTADGPALTVRVVEYIVHATGPDGTATSELFYLVTDLVDVEQWPASGLAEAYRDRWTVEIVIDHHKTDLGDGQPVLRSRLPDNVDQEMWALFAVYQGLRHLMVTAADAVVVPPSRISFRHALTAAPPP